MTILAKSTDANVMAEINVTPFTDVLLVLLIVFMILAALVVPPGFERNLPNCHCSGPARPARKPLVVTIDARGRMFVDARPTDAQRIYGDLLGAASRDARIHVNVEADSKARYALVIRVLDAAKFAGLSDLTLVTQ